MVGKEGKAQFSGVAYAEYLIKMFSCRTEYLAIYVGILVTINKFIKNNKADDECKKLWELKDKDGRRFQLYTSKMGSQCKGQIIMT